MKRSTYGMVLGAFALTLGLWSVARTEAADDEVPKEVKDGILKIADLFEKGKADDAKKAAADLAKKAGFDGGKPGSNEALMHVFSPRKKKGLGVGEKPDMIKPDGIELKIQLMADEKKKLAPKLLATEAPDLKKMAFISAAVGEITLAATPKKDNGKMKAADWKKWSEEMRDSALKLAAATGEKTPEVKAVQTAAKNLDATCTSCHEVFRK